LIQVGADENRRDDAVRMAEKASREGALVEIEVWRGMHHVFQLHSTLISAQRALDRAARFLAKHMTK